METLELDIDSAILSSSQEERAWQRRQELVAVPRPELLESPSSWITRFALTQGTEVAELASFLNLTLEGDFDLSFSGGGHRRLGVRCGVGPEDFLLMEMMFGRLQKIDKTGHIYLLSQDGFPQYRYCPACLSGQTTNYFPLHWRFKAWRLCPLHDVLLHDRCPHCEAVVVLPNDQICGGRGRRGIASIGDCFVCGKSLYLNRPQNRFEASRGQITPKERLLYSNGRALLAALYTGCVRIGEEMAARNLRSLNALVQAGCFAHETLHYEKYRAHLVTYRHPRTHALVHINREADAPPRRSQWMGGLFDG